uniref:hypothetical protein n=1 Tax=uncultured Caulobacter sp. TaxID=158749 RepID=UPI0025D50154|nr:hypothetical protein [uncultured Caulobacter sp.]
MSPTSLTSDEHSLLREIRNAGSVVLHPEARSFADAESLTRKGLARAVTIRGVASSTFLLSGDGFALAGRLGPFQRSEDLGA